MNCLWIILIYFAITSRFWNSCDVYADINFQAQISANKYVFWSKFYYNNIVLLF